MQQVGHWCILLAGDDEWQGKKCRSSQGSTRKRLCRPAQYFPRGPGLADSPHSQGEEVPSFSLSPVPKLRRRCQAKMPLSGRPYTSNLPVNAFSSTLSPDISSREGRESPPKMLVLTAIRPHTQLNEIKCVCDPLPLTLLQGMDHTHSSGQQWRLKKGTGRGGDHGPGNVNSCTLCV